jgi:ATP-dependent helicase/nuclease subunit A
MTLTRISRAFRNGRAGPMTERLAMTETLPQALLLAFAEKKQQRAADPSVSAWVRANAGTGKTHVLVQRILRLLLSGANPRSVLCLTFTKNAAAEMEGRVLAKLGEWATAEDGALKGRLAALLSRGPSEAEIALARCVFATVIDAPGGLAIMTIHSFCERVLRRYSLEANVPPGFAVLTEEEARDALHEACASAFAAASSGPLRNALNCAAGHANEGEFARVLQAMLAKRNEAAHLFSVTAADDPFPAMDRRLRRLFNLSSADTKERLIERSCSVLDPQTLKAAIAALLSGGKTDSDGASRLEAVRRAPDSESTFAALKDAFLTKSGSPRASLMTASVRKRSEALHERLAAAQEAFLALGAKLSGLRLTEASIALLRLAGAIFERYEQAKRARGAVDFDDLIGKTLNLLSRQEAAEWVLYEIDARIDHILVDEAQDTSPQQWAIVEKLTSDFFAGQGARDVAPTLFAVGDEKQSIYGFQGAVPELLGDYGLRYETKVGLAGLEWCAADLDLSFRTLDPILSAVDQVSHALPGLQPGKAVRHLAYRRERGGLVELWPPERGEKAEKGTVWEPDGESAPAAKPSHALAGRIAAQIKHWLDTGEGLASCGRPIEPGDILILLRKRAPMAQLIQCALRREGIRVSGADRIAIIDELAVMDLLALGDALLQPEDDLALAAVLKSPLFGLTEDDLFALCHGREGSLWEALGLDPRFSAAARRLRAWRELAAAASPFDFYAHILEAEGGRKDFAARLGAECFEAIGELLALAETFSARPQASLSEFVTFARKSASEIKRETDQASGEVRIMTVHGAKGLEANIVILADTCSSKNAPPAPVYLIGDDSGAPQIPVWAVKGTGSLQPVQDAKDAIDAGNRRELGRLLYVAMTRPRDRLYISGFHSGLLPEGCWYETIRNALAPQLAEMRDFEGRAVWRMGVADDARVRARRPQAAEAAALPVWLSRPAPAEARQNILSPSKLIEERVAASSTSHTGIDRKSAQNRGTLIHRLLEVLPALPSADRGKAAGLIASAFSGDLTAEARKECVGFALGLLSNKLLPELRADDLSEAGIAVAALDKIIFGQADRVLLSGDQITVLDYKSGTLGPESGIRRSYLAQLACYRLALTRLYPTAKVHASLLETKVGTIVHAADHALDKVLEDVMGSGSQALKG